MLENMTDELRGATHTGIGRTFRRVGMIGFWIQLVIAAFPVLVGLLLFFTNRAQLLPGGRFDFIGYLAIASLLILAFTTVWFLLYARTGSRIEKGEDIPASRLQRAVWIGLAASSLGIMFSTVVMIYEVAYLLVSFLEAPQAGVPVIQTNTDAAWISAVDILSLKTLIMTVAAEVVVLVLGLWLLYRVTLSAPSGPKQT